MNIPIEKISRNRFEDLKSKLVFQDENSTQFALVGHTSATYCFGWRSAEVELEARMIDDQNFSVGVDQFFAIVGIETWNIVMKKHLDCFYMGSTIVEGRVYFFSEMSTFIYLIEEREFFAEVDHPDVYQEHTIENGRVIVECMNGDKIVVG